MDIQYGDSMPDDIQQAVLLDQHAAEGRAVVGMYRQAGYIRFAQGANKLDEVSKTCMFLVEYAKRLEDQIYHSKPKKWWQFWK
jgi:hypothetical protein